MEQTILERQFSEIVVEGLFSKDNNTSRIWSILNALKIEIIDIIGTENTLYKELMHYIVEGDDPIDVYIFVCNLIRSNKYSIKSNDYWRLLAKIKNIVKWGHE